MSDTAAIERECERLSLNFARFVDENEPAKVVALFTTDAVFERRGEQLVGHDMILAAQNNRDARVKTRHFCTNICIDVIDGFNAIGQTYFMLFRHDAAAPDAAASTLPAAIGTYHDKFRRTESGWKISERLARALIRR